MIGLHNKIIGAANYTSCNPASQFFLSLTINSNLTDCKVTINTKILLNLIASGGFATDPIVQTVHDCTKLYFEFDCLIVFHHMYIDFIVLFMMRFVIVFLNDYQYEYEYQFLLPQPNNPLLRLWCRSTTLRYVRCLGYSGCHG